MTSVTPLPSTLSGNIIQRLIEIDEALIPYVNGALVWLCDKEPFEETGVLTVDEAKILFSDMLQIYFTEIPAMIPVGAFLMWQETIPPENWLLCDGGAAFVAEWPDLFALWGYRYGGAGTQFGLPDFGDLSPMGAGGNVDLDDTAGSVTHTLTVDQMPAHTHAPLSPNTTFLGNRAGATNTAPSGSGIGTATTTGSTGGGLPHNNLHPVFGTNYIVFAGKQVI